TGIYTLQLTANDSQYSVSSSVIYTVVSNQPPSVAAVASPNVSDIYSPVSLQGFATDDGLPGPQGLVTAWSVLSGPGGVSFSNAANTNTSVIFTNTGSYVLQLMASDGQLTSTANVTVTIS